MIIKDIKPEHTAKPEGNEHIEILAQCDQLRDEILHNDTLSLQLFAATLLLISAAMGFAVYVVIALANFILIVYYTFKISNDNKHQAVFLSIFSLLIWLTMVVVAYRLYTKYVREEEKTFEVTWKQICDDEKAHKRYILKI